MGNNDACFTKAANGQLCNSKAAATLTCRRDYNTTNAIGSGAIRPVPKNKAQADTWHWAVTRWIVSETKVIRRQQVDWHQALVARIAEYMTISRVSHVQGSGKREPERQLTVAKAMSAIPTPK